MAERFKNEIILEKSSFNSTEFRKDKIALAQVIQNILFIEPGTYPNQPNLGVGIENYLFEKMDNSTLIEIENAIKEQIDQFCPSEYIVTSNVTTQKIKNNSILLISFSIKDPDAGTETDFGVLVGKTEKSKKLVSRLLI